jgi:glycosyltransferase involved in cell wall biosynthesis
VSKDSRFVYLKKENGGLSSARNAGINTAKGVFILPLDADDKIGAEYCELAVKEFDKYADLKVVYCLAEKFGEEQGLWQLPEFSLKLLAKNNIIFCSAFFKKRDWIESGGYDEKMIYGLEDWEFWIHILKSGGRVKRIEMICFFYRVKKVSMAKNLNLDKTEFLNIYVNKKHVDFFLIYLGSFNKNLKELELKDFEFKRKLKSKRFVIDVLFKIFLGFTLFNTLEDKDE